MALYSDRTMIILSKAGRAKKSDSQKEISFRLTSRSVLFLFVGTVTAATTTAATTATRYTVTRVWFAVRRGTAAATTFTTIGIFAALTAGGTQVARTAGLLFPHFLPDMIFLHFLILFLTEAQHGNALIRFTDSIKTIFKVFHLISDYIFKNISIFLIKKRKTLLKLILTC